MRPIGLRAHQAIYRIIEPKNEHATAAGKPRVVIWDERDEWIALCVKMGLNAREISNLSLSWPQPLRTTQQVYEKISQIRLERRYRSAQKRLRSSSHDRNIIFAFSKFTGQALEYGLTVRHVMRDSVPYPGMRFRPDLSFQIDAFLFYVEVQTSKIEGTRWYEKFRNYLKLYKLMRRPFRVLFLVDKAVDVSILRRRAREVLTDNPKLNLFLFMTLDEFHFRGDVLKAHAWLTPEKKLVTLI